jgi:hypothetical protein
METRWDVLARFALILTYRIFRSVAPVLLVPVLGALIFLAQFTVIMSTVAANPYHLGEALILCIAAVL